MAKRTHYTEHPSVVVINKKPFLRVFEDFFVEEQLPKWQKYKATTTKGAETQETVDANGDTADTAPNREERILVGVAAKDQRDAKKILDDSKWDRKRYLRNRTISSTGTKKSLWRRFHDLLPWTDQGDPVEKVFEEAKESLVSPTTEELIKGKAVAEALIKKLTVAGQYGFAERVKGEVDVLENELALIQHGLCKYLTEDQIIKFMLKAERGVRVEFLRYYNEILPEDVMEHKVAADGFLVFDNYVVMHYSQDPKFQLIEEEIDDREREKRRDPILFGVMRNSRKLYYICDWVTDDDDLTMEAIEQALGIRANMLNQDEAVNQQPLERLLTSLDIDINKNLEEARREGRLITEANFEALVKEGKIEDPGPIELEPDDKAIRAAMVINAERATSNGGSNPSSPTD